MDDPDLYEITLEIQGDPIRVQLHLDRSRATESGKDGGLFPINPPWLQIWPNGSSVVHLLIHWDLFAHARFEDGNLQETAVEVLLFAAPRIAEMELPVLLQLPELPSQQDRSRVVKFLDPANLVRWKEEAAGETYEQRSHM